MDVVLGLPDVIFRISFQHLDLHGEDPLLTLHDSEMDFKSKVYANARTMMAAIACSRQLPKKSATPPSHQLEEGTPGREGARMFPGRNTKYSEVDKRV